MQGFVAWLDSHPFYVKDSWDESKQKMVSGGTLDLFPFQRRILEYCLTPNDEGEFPFVTIVLSMVKKSGKTLLAAAIAAWYAECAQEGSEIYILSNDLEQAAERVMKDVKHHVKMVNQYSDIDSDPIKVIAHKIVYPNDTTIQALSTNYKTVAGSRHGLVLVDELHGATSEDSRRLWEEMTPIPTVPNSLRVVTTYAGFLGESMLLWDLYKNGVGDDEYDEGKGIRIEELGDLPCWRNGKQFTYWDHEPRMPWQTPDYYQEQLNILRPAQYLRLHENQWVSTHETFIPIEWWDKAAKAFPGQADLYLEHPYRRSTVFIGVDGAIKKDCLAVVGVTFDPAKGKIALLFHKIWTPHPGDPLDLEATLETYLLKQKTLYTIGEVAYDPAQILQSMLRLKTMGIPTFEFIQHPNNMLKASQSLFDAFRGGNMLAYPDEECKQHIQNSVALEDGRGFRIVKDTRNKTIFKPQDFTIALAMAVHRAIINLGSSSTRTVYIESPFSDMRTRESQKVKALPWMFQP
jgi:phage terminase large subunit-like protein